MKTFGKILELNKTGNMLKDVPYNMLKNQNIQDYEIMLLHDQNNMAFTEISKKYQVSNTMVISRYNRVKYRQVQLYINHIAFVLKGKTTSKFENLYDILFECYQDMNLICAYLEKTYDLILTKYRAGEPGLPIQFIKEVPPFVSISKETISQLVKMRDVKQASFISIAKTFRITQAKAKHVYESYYKQKVETYMKYLQANAKNIDELITIWNVYDKWNTVSYKKRYDILTKDTIL